MRWAAICAVALLSGCSLGGDDEPVPATGAPREIAALIGQLELASQRRDGATVCEDLLTPGARLRAGGRACARRVGRGLAPLREPRLTLLGIRLRRDRALVRVRAEQRGRSARDQLLELRRVRGEWRIEALRR
jgi:hypothetical protein